LAGSLHHMMVNANIMMASAKPENTRWPSSAFRGPPASSVLPG
jgi:hypothetical protein